MIALERPFYAKLYHNIYIEIVYFNIHMYKKIAITENMIRTLCLFTEGFNNALYVREVHKKAGISPRTAQLVLEELEKKGVMTSKTRGKIKEYTLQTNDITKNYLLLAETYKTITFLETNLLIKEIIEKITTHIKGIGIIFGSYAKNSQTKTSDIDIFVAGTCDENKIEEIAKTYGKEINVKCYPEEVFAKEQHKDILLKEIAKNHLLLTGMETYVNEAINTWIR